MLNESQLTGVLGAVAFDSETSVMYIYTDGGWLSLFPVRHALDLCYCTMYVTEYVIILRQALHVAITIGYNYIHT